MRTWLAAAAAVPLVSLFAAPELANGLRSPVAEIPRTASNFVLPTIPQFNPQSPLRDGMIAQEEVAPNAHVGLGLAPMLGRNIRSVRIEQEPVPTRNPGVTFVINFPG
ncbi:MAG TPA: hypothetical protein VGU01_09385 [Sphingomicrobium sp.]|nr:hypothetical protein [Sphingomicrobium sp.]